MSLVALRSAPVIALLLSSSLIAGAQTSTGPASTGTQTITGRTVNALTGTPINRALVRCGATAMLTDYEGRFQCAPDGSTVTLTATKPGYFLSEDPGESGDIVLRAPLPAVAAEIRMFPEAILTGNLTAANGDPLSGISILANRILYDEGGRHPGPAMATRTDSHGTFRLAVAPGRYRLQTSYSPPTTARPQAVLSQTFPDGSSSSFSNTILARSGETIRVDLHPVLAPVVTVSAHLEPDTSRGNLRITARPASGGDIPLRAAPSANPGEIRLSMPSGGYQLEATKRAPEGLQQAQTSITVGDRDMSGVVLRFLPINPIPVELLLEPSSRSDNTRPTFSDLSLALEDVQQSSSDQNSASWPLLIQDSSSAAFNPLPGSYRLRSRGGGTWFVQAATFGTTDLLRDNLVVVAGAGTVPIRILASNQTASLAGTLRLGNEPAPGWIYLVSSTPSATPILIVHANADGTYSRSGLPPGTYRAIAFEHRHAINFEDPETLVTFSNELRSVTLQSGDKATLDLDLAPPPEAR